MHQRRRSQHRDLRWFATVIVLILAAATVAVGAAAKGTSTRRTTNDAATMRAKVAAQLAVLLKSSGKTLQKLPAIPNSPCKNPKTVPLNQLVVGYASPGRTNTWEVQNQAGGNYYLANYPGIKGFYVTDGQDNPSKQISDIQSLISRGINLLVVDPATTASSPAIQQACARGITVVTYDRFVTPSTGVTGSMYADEVQDGYNIGADIVKALHGKGNVVILAGLPGIGVSDYRAQGAKLAFSKAPGIKVLAEGYSKYDPAIGKTIMAQWLTKYPKIDAVWSDSGIQAQGAIQALQAANRLSQAKMIGGGQLTGYLRQCVQLKIACSGSTISTDVGVLATQLGIDIATGKIHPSHNVVAPLVVIPPNKIKAYYRPDLPDSYWATLLLPNSLLKQIYKK